MYTGDQGFTQDNKAHYGYVTIDVKRRGAFVEIEIDGLPSKFGAIFKPLF